MKPMPTDPLGRHGRFIAALCDDLASSEFLRNGKTPRTDALLATSRQGEAGGPACERETLTSGTPEVSGPGRSSP